VQRRPQRWRSDGGRGMTELPPGGDELARAIVALLACVFLARGSAPSVGNAQRRGRSRASCSVAKVVG